MQPDFRAQRGLGAPRRSAPVLRAAVTGTAGRGTMLQNAGFSGGWSSVRRLSLNLVAIATEAQRSQRRNGKLYLSHDHLQGAQGWGDNFLIVSVRSVPLWLRTFFRFRLLRLSDIRYSDRKNAEAPDGRSPTGASGGPEDNCQWQVFRLAWRKT
jgi:hypothetical protein